MGALDQSESNFAPAAEKFGGFLSHSTWFLRTTEKKAKAREILPRV